MILLSFILMDPLSPGVLLHTGESLLEEGKYTEALRLLEGYPFKDSPEYFFLKGKALLLKGEPCRACSLFQKIKYTEEGRYWMGICLMEMGRYTEAETLLENAPPEILFFLSLRKSSQDARKYLGRMKKTWKTLALAHYYYAAGNPWAAKKYFSEAMGLPTAEEGYLLSCIKTGFYDEVIKRTEGKREPFFLFLRGVAFYHKKRYSEALQAFEGAVEKYPFHSLFSIGWCYYRKGMYKKAGNIFKSIEKNAPLSLLPYVIYREGRAYLKYGVVKEAIDCFKRIIEKFGAHSLSDDALLLLGKAYMVVDSLDEAYLVFERLVKEKKKSRWVPYAMKLMGEIKEKKGEKEEAVRIYEELEKLRLPPELLDEIRYRREYLKYELGHYRTLLEFRKAFVKKYPESPRVPSLLRDIAKTYEKWHRYREALKYYREAAEKEKKEGKVESLLDISHLYMIMGKWEEAVGVVKEALEVREAPELWIELGDIYREAEKYPEAIECYEKAMKEKGPLLWEAGIKISEIYRRLGKREEERLVLRELAKNKLPSSVLLTIYRMLYENLREEGMFEEIRDMFEEAEGRLEEREKAEIYVLRGDFLCEQGDTSSLRYYLMAVDAYGEELEKIGNTFLKASKCAENLGFDSLAHEYRIKGEIFLKRR